MKENIDINIFENNQEWGYFSNALLERKNNTKNFSKDGTFIWISFSRHSPFDMGGCLENSSWAKAMRRREIFFFSCFLHYICYYYFILRSHGFISVWHMTLWTALGFQTSVNNRQKLLIEVLCGLCSLI